MKNFKYHLLPIMLLTLVVIILNYTNVNLYFRLDDYFSLYAIQQAQPIYFPYQYLFYLTKPLYSLFGMNPQGYYFIGIVLYLNAACFLYVLIFLWFRSRLLAFLGILTFISSIAGREAMLMFLGDGIVTLTGLNILLLMLIYLTKLYRTYEKKYLVFIGLLLFLILEIAPLRYAGVIFIVTGVNILIYLKQRRNQLIYAKVIFISIFLIQYLFHPSHYILGYPLLSSNTYDYSASIGRINILNTFTPIYIGNSIGTFGNLFYPSLLQDDLYFLLTRELNKPFNQSFWFSTVPTLVFAFLMFLLSFLLKYKKSSKLRFVFLWAIFVTFYISWGHLVFNAVRGELDKIYTMNGGIILAILLYLYIARIPFNNFYPIFAIFIIFSILSIFLLSKPDVLLISTHRYLISVVFAPALAMSFFVTRELYEKKNLKNIAIMIFIIPVLLLSLSNFYIESKISKSTKYDYSKNAARFYRELKGYIPKIEGKIIIYLEGGTKNFNYILGDITRGGYFSSEAVLATHYNTDKDNIVLSESAKEIEFLLKNQPDISLNNVYSFIYSEDGLHDTSKGLRNLLSGNKHFYSIDPIQWRVNPDLSMLQNNDQSIVTTTTYFKQEARGTLGVYPVLIFTGTKNINTQLPLSVSIKIKAVLPNNLQLPYYHLFNRPEGAPENLWPEILSWEKNQCHQDALQGEFECVENKERENLLLSTKKSGEIEIMWDYDYFGSIAEEKSAKLKILLDGLWHEYSFTIPSGGQYLDKLSIKYISFPGIISIGETKLIYK